MAGGKLQAPRGTFDVLPEDARRRAALRAACAELFGARGLRPDRDARSSRSTELFARGVGETTDIVQKEMFTFEDQGGALADAAAGGHGGRSAAPTSSTACTSCRSR